jgi:hypothetical protein
MTIPLKEFMARSFTNPDVKREYAALGPEFEALAESPQARQSQTIESFTSRRIVESDSDLAPKR